MPKINITLAKAKVVKQLTPMISKLKMIVAYEPLAKQLGSSTILTSRFFNASHLSALENHINDSDNHAMTILTHLLVSERFDLIPAVVSNPLFNKINYKCSLPFQAGLGRGLTYASALDFVIQAYLVEGKEVQLTAIESLLSHGAKPPVPGKKFINAELLTFFHPIICGLKAGISISQLAKLTVLLSAYGLDIAALKQDFEETLFTGNSAEEFATMTESAEDIAHAVSVADQRQNLDYFFRLVDKLKQTQCPQGNLHVEMTAERLDDGQSTLRLAYDPTDAPCSVM